eukprot:5132362-Pyramimonas_sp.AAC.1
MQLRTQVPEMPHLHSPGTRIRSAWPCSALTCLLKSNAGWASFALWISSQTGRAAHLWPPSGEVQNERLSSSTWLATWRGRTPPVRLH